MATLDNITKKQADTIVCLQTGRPERRRGTSKTWSQYSRQHQSQKKKMLAANVQAALSFCEEHWVPASLELVNVETGCREVLNVEDGSFSNRKSCTTLSENE